MKKLATLLLSLALLVLQVSTVLATVDPLSVPNNIFGIHLMDENDLTDAASLVNSNGGDWGYVTIVIREDERDTARWNRAFDRMQQLHLIPLVRITTTMTEDGWTKGDTSEIILWKAFLNSLNWPTQNRYVIIGNEPNHATEWHSEISPEEYSDYLVMFSRTLKYADDRYFILPAGLDASAPSDKNHMDEVTFINRMYNHNPAVFDSIDGWNSHSYPNPGFMGSPTDSGRKSIKTYEWELEVLSNLGVEKSLPVFITETGWVHTTSEDTQYLDPETVSDYLQTAFTTVWTDERIVAVTPFMLTYPGKPFLQFAWRDETGEFLSFYYTVQELPKTKGDPVMVQKLESKETPVPQNDLLAHIDRYKKIVSVANATYWVS